MQTDDHIIVGHVNEAEAAAPVKVARTCEAPEGGGGTSHDGCQTSSTTTMTTTTTHPPSLTTTVLFHDITPEGNHMLLPYLKTKDLLRLSECRHDLLAYRLYLSRVELVPYSWGWDDPAMRGGLWRLMKEQKGQGVQYLRVEDRHLLEVLEELVRLGCLEGLKTLDLSEMGLQGADDAACVGRMLSGGRLRGLEGLHLKGLSFDSSPDDLNTILDALAQGACPGLRQLNLGMDLDEPRPYLDCMALARALESGKLRCLEELDVRGAYMVEGDLGAIARALEGRHCPELRRLAIPQSPPVADWWALCDALRSRACSKLESLEGYFKDDDDDGDEVVVPFLEALEAGGCPNLRRLDLAVFYVNTEAVQALAHVLSSGHCQRLQQMELSFVLRDPAAGLCVMQAIRRGTWTHMQVLHIGGCHLGPEHGLALGQAIAEGKLPRLEQLHVGWNGGLGDGGMVPILAGLEEGGCPDLKVLTMNSVEAGPETAAALARALTSTRWRGLRVLSIDGNQRWGDHGLADVVSALASGPSRDQLRDLGAAWTGMGEEAGQALLKAVREGAWPNLEGLDIGDNPGLGDGVVGVGLAEVFKGGAGARIKVLAMRDMGEVGAQSLCDAIGQGALPRLKQLLVDKGACVNWEGAVADRHPAVQVIRSHR